MLTTLYIENIAVIKQTNIDFGSGLNVLTGETGAGKSIVIDAISAIIGQRTSKDIIRTGAVSAYVSATFEKVNPRVKQLAENMGCTVEDDTIIIVRELNVNGKNTCRINSRPVTVSVLKELGALLINIHGQHESYELMSPDLHINYIDSIANIGELLEQYTSEYQKYKELYKELLQLNDNENLRMQKIDLLRYQIDELSSADLQEGEIDLLNEERTILLNSEKIARSLFEAKATLSGDDEQIGAIDAISSAAAALQNAVRYFPSIEGLASRILDISYELEDCSEEISQHTENLESDPQRLEYIEERLDTIYKLGRKYGSTIEQMQEFLQSAINELEYLEQYDENKQKLQQKCDDAFNKAKKLSLLISKKRKEAAKEFCTKVQSEMAFLDMPKVQIVVSQTECELYEKGCDKIEFLISTNPGEAPKPVSKIASGGELSRMMLAIKTVLSMSDSVDTLIFDEVDTGISGSAAQKVGVKLKQVSKDSQVLCVTHQAQIAALANNHYLISKHFEDEKTFTNVELLDNNGRKLELARIIGGTAGDGTAISFAEQLLKNSEQMG